MRSNFALEPIFALIVLGSTSVDISGVQATKPFDICGVQALVFSASAALRPAVRRARPAASLPLRR